MTLQEACRIAAEGLQFISEHDWRLASRKAGGAEAVAQALVVLRRYINGGGQQDETHGSGADIDARGYLGMYPRAADARRSTPRPRADG